MDNRTERAIVAGALVAAWALGVASGYAGDWVLGGLSAALGLGTMAHAAHMLDAVERRPTKEPRRDP